MGATSVAKLSQLERRREAALSDAGIEVVRYWNHDVLARTEQVLEDKDDDAATVPLAAARPMPWPKDAVEQVRAVADVLAASPIALTLDEVAARFSARGRWKKRLPPLLDMLVAIGRVHEQGGRYMRSNWECRTSSCRWLRFFLPSSSRVRARLALPVRPRPSSLAGCTRASVLAIVAADSNQERR